MLKVLIDFIKLRRRIERDYEKLKSEHGLAQFEGRAGEASIITQAFALQPTDSWLSQRAAFPPSVGGVANDLPFPVVLDPRAPPIRL